ncbi:MAG: sialidase family protein [Candidatus Thorarchaeota archaeon]
MMRSKILCGIVLILFSASIIQPSYNNSHMKQSELEPIDIALVQADYSEVVAFSENILISTNDGADYQHHVEPTLVIDDDGRIFVGYKNSETHNGGGNRVSFSRSDDGGVTWTTPYNMPHFDEVTTRQSDPWLVWFNGTIYYAYLEFRGSGDDFSQITVSKSKDNGQTWTSAAASHGSYFADKETMTIADDGTIYVAYDDIDSGEEGGVVVKLTRSINGGASFSERSIIGPFADGHVGPYVTLNSLGHIYVAWTWLEDEGGNLYLDKSTDGGDTFGDEEFINDDGNFSAYTEVDERPAFLTIPVIRFDQYDRLYVLWADRYDPIDGTFDIYLRYSDDFGEAWSRRFKINPVYSGDQWQPDMDIDEQGRLHIVYYHSYAGFIQPHYRRLEFVGVTKNAPIFSEPVVIASEYTSSYFPRPGDYFTVRVDNESIPHVVWTDGRNDELDIYYAHGLVDTSSSSATTSSSSISTQTMSTTDIPTTSSIDEPYITTQTLIIGFTGFAAAVLVIIWFRRRRL